MSEDIRAGKGATPSGRRQKVRRRLTRAPLLREALIQRLLSLGIVLAAGIVALLAIYARPLTQSIAVGAADDRAATLGFLDRERNPAGTTYRWTDDSSTLLFRGAGLAFPANRPVEAAVTLAASRPAGVAPPRVTLDLNGRVIESRALAEETTTAAGAGAIGGGATDARLTIASDTFTPPGDRRVLGVAVLGAARLVEATGAGPAVPSPGAWWRWLLALASGWGVALGLTRRPRWAGVAAGVWLAALTVVAALARPQFWEYIHLPLLLLLILLPIAWRDVVAASAARLLAHLERRWGVRAPLLALGGVILLGAAQALLTSGNTLLRAEIVPPLALAVGAPGLLLLLATLLVVAPGGPSVAPGDAPGGERGPVSGERDRAIDRRLELALLAGIALLAAGARFYRLGDIPFGMWRDEARHGLEALSILDDPTYRPVYIPNISLPGLYPTLLALDFRAFGATLASLRGLTSAGGVGAVVALWAVARQLWGPRVALVAATLAAVGSWRISIDRLAFDTGPTTLCTLGAFALFLLGVARVRAGGRGLAAFAGAGLLGAGAIYGYYPGRFALPTIAGGALVLLLTERGGFARRIGTGLALLVATAAIALVPLGRYAVEQPDNFFKRTEQVFLLSDQYTQGQTKVGAVEQNLLRHVAMFNWQGEPNARHYLPRWPMLDAVTAAAFVLGLALALGAALRLDFAALFVLGWLGALLAPSIVSVDAPSAVRAMDAAPAAYGLAGLGLVATWRRLRAPDAPGWLRRAAPALLGVALAAAITLNGWIYFVRMPGDPRVLGKFQYVGETRAGLAICAARARTPGLAVYVPNFFLANGDSYNVLRFTSGEAALRELPGDPSALPPGPLLLIVPRGEEQDFDAQVAAARRIARAAGLREVEGERTPGTAQLTYVAFVRDQP